MCNVAHVINISINNKTEFITNEFVSWGINSFAIVLFDLVQSPLIVLIAST